MSLVRLVFPRLHWAELSFILEFLCIRDVWRLGCTNRSAFVTFLREKSLRKHYVHNQTSIARFLCKYSDHHKILLVSYPRSGNSFVRQLLELETGIITGSDSRPNRTLASQLLECGYRGEGITDNSVWVVKSHYPERLGYIRFRVHRAILVVRNPFDAIESYFHMGLTNTHDRSLTTEAFDSLRSVWTEFVENEAKIWARFHSYWIERIEKEGFPSLIMRYEDLLEHKELRTKQMVQLMSNGRRPSGWRDRGPRVRGSAVAAGYQPKRKVVGRGFSVMSERERAMVMKHCSSLMHAFGYNVHIMSGCSEEGAVQQQLVVGAMSERFDVHRDRLHNSSSNHHEQQFDNSVEINDPLQDLRTESDPFGRKIMQLRKAFTNNDTEPLPTIK